MSEAARSYDSSPRLLTTREAAARCGLAPKTLYMWGLEGRGPRRIHLGRTVRYDPQDLDAWIEKGRDGA